MGSKWHKPLLPQMRLLYNYVVICSCILSLYGLKYINVILT